MTSQVSIRVDISDFKDLISVCERAAEVWSAEKRSQFSKEFSALVESRKATKFYWEGPRIVSAPSSELIALLVKYGAVEVLP